MNNCLFKIMKLELEAIFGIPIFCFYSSPGLIKVDIQG
jgi:hypothetical protein